MWQDYRGTVLAVTHDRYFLDNVAGDSEERDGDRGFAWLLLYHIINVASHRSRVIEAVEVDPTPPPRVLFSQAGS